MPRAVIRMVKSNLTIIGLSLIGGGRAAHWDRGDGGANGAA
jgi:hypothetical protein